MPRYKDSPEVRAAKQERREKLRELLALMEVEYVRDLKSEIGQDCRCTTRLTSVESVTCFRSGLALASEPNPKEEKYSPPRKNPQRAYLSGYSADLTLTVCNGLINQLLQRLCLFLGGYRTDNRIAYDVAVLVNNICCWIRVQSGGEFPGLAF